MMSFIQSYLGISENTFLVELTACMMLLCFVIVVISALFGVLINIFSGRR